jgi:putative ABC transport system permease protein
MALGAAPRDVLALVMRQGLPAVDDGLAAGLLLARAVGLAIAGTLYRVDANDPAPFFAVAALLGASVPPPVSFPRGALRASIR